MQKSSNSSIKFFKYGDTKLFDIHTNTFISYEFLSIFKGLNYQKEDIIHILHLIKSDAQTIKQLYAIF